MKICSKCKENKSLINFSKNNSQKDNLQRYCKECKSKFDKGSLRKKEYTKFYNSKEEVKIQKTKYNKKYWVENKESSQNYSKKWREVNREKVNKYQREWKKNLYHHNIYYKIGEILRSRFWSALNNNSKTDSVLDLIGCSIKDLKLYLENKFLEEMNWGNYGEIWEIDHIKPCSVFNLEEIDEQKECFSYKNLQPLFKTDLISKSLGYKEYIGNRNKGKKYTK